MSVIERLQNANALVKGILALLALCPGILLFIGLVEIPPSVGKIIYLLSFFVSVLAILAIILMTDWVERLGNTVAVTIAAVSLAAGSVCLVMYMQYATGHIIPITDDRDNEVKFLAPNSPSPEILRIVPHQDAGRPTIAEYQFALQLHPERAHLKRLIVAESLGVMVVMLLMLVGAEVLLLTPIVALAWKLAGGTAKPATTT